MVEFLKNRITELRMKRGVSEYQMSYDLGHSRGYINNISSGKSLPSIPEFFSICEYLEVTPMDFFDAEHEEPERITRAVKEIRELDDEDLALVLAIVERLKQNKKYENSD